MPLTVNGETVPEQAIAQEAESLLQRFRQLSEAERAQNGFTEEVMQQRAVEWARENLIERTLMRQEAAKDPEPVPEDVLAKAREAIVKRFGGEEKLAEADVDQDMIQAEAELTVKLDRLLGRVASKVKPPKSKDVAAAYRHHRENWKVPESAHAAHIVKHVNEEVSAKDAQEAIDAVKQRLDAGEAFETVADEASDCPGNGGDLGWFTRGKMVEDFEEVVFQMEPGQVSEPFRSVFGFHIARLFERKPATLRPLNEVKDQIEKQLVRERETKAVEDFVDALRAKADIENTVEEAVTAG